jgi:hypothetical protein
MRNKKLEDEIDTYGEGGKIKGKSEKAVLIKAHPGEAVLPKNVVDKIPSPESNKDIAKNIQEKIKEITHTPGGKSFKWGGEVPDKKDDLEDRISVGHIIKKVKDAADPKNVPARKQKLGLTDKKGSLIIPSKGSKGGDDNTTDVSGVLKMQGFLIKAGASKSKAEAEVINAKAYADKVKKDYKLGTAKLDDLKTSLASLASAKETLANAKKQEQETWSKVAEKEADAKKLSAETAARTESRLRGDEAEVAMRTLALRKLDEEHAVSRGLRSQGMDVLISRIDTKEKLKAIEQEARLKEKLRKESERAKEAEAARKRPVSLEVSKIFRPQTRVTSKPPVRLVHKSLDRKLKTPRQYNPPKKLAIRRKSPGWFRQQQRHATVATRAWMKKKKR